LFCQTSPTPHPEPDVNLFLHGKNRGAPEVRVLWRADLSPENRRTWIETVALCPPASGEMLSVPLCRLRAWLSRPDARDDSADVEGIPEAGEEPSGQFRPCLLWRGRDRSTIADEADDILPGDVVAVPAAYGIEGLGHSAAAEALGNALLDLREPVLANAGRPLAVRLHRAVLEPWLACPPLSELIAIAESPNWDRETAQDAIDAVLGYEPQGEDDHAAPPSWWLELLKEVRSGRMEGHPGGGIVLFARNSAEGLRRRSPTCFSTSSQATTVTRDRLRQSDSRGEP
jgi:CRISPR-associated endonuclease/helicase Cas3